jgi:glycosyltransferase involved in cell wall biosynthesis
MKIGISTRGLNQGSHAISTIIYNLTQTILRLASKDHEIILYLNDPAFAALFDPSTPKRYIKLDNRLIWDQIWLPAALNRDKVDLALFMKGTMPLLLPCKGAVIFHDLGYFDTELRPYKFAETLYMKRMMALAGVKASFIFSDSEYTKSETIKHLGIDEGKITLCYPDCSPIFKPTEDNKTIDQVKSIYKLPAPYIFSPTSLSPRKNLFRILDAFKGIKELIPHHLVITGGQSWGLKNLKKRIATEFNNRVHVLGTVPPDHMPAIYKLASFTLYPSLIEGFGIPILESFRCGCPVLTSNITSMPEVAGDAAYLVNPYDHLQISEGMLRMATDLGLRNELIRKGFERSNFFSWEKTARTILDVILEKNIEC